MALLLDTHAFLWWLAGDRKLPRRAREAIANPDEEVIVSAVSAWEITTKYRLGKLPGARAIANDIAGAIASQSFTALPVTVVHAQRAGALVGDHRDPFDRMLIAQARSDDLILVSNEELFDAFGVSRLW
ncbi:MAG TPA: type II toxin-antitoxin system VapC family toxin [Kofleriaceae bacterium]|nr:type II toxin-antitoxin system VapC family toxin [Kofleriaceae bacterium]